MTPNLHRFLIITSIIGLLLAACGAAPSQSWSGVALSADSSTIYVTQNTHLFAIAPGGTKRWQFPADNASKGTFYADPVVAGDLIILPSYDTKLVYALNASDGLLKWTYPSTTQSQGFISLPGPADPTAPADRLVAPVAVYNDTIYVPSSDNSLYALDLNGNYKWKFTTEASLWGAPLPVGDVILVPSMDHNLYAIDAATGSQTWVANLNGAAAGAPALSADGATAYVGTLSDTLYAIDVKTGATNWTVTADGWVWGTPLVAGDTLYFGDLQGSLFAVNTDGSLKWKVQPGGTIRSTPALVGESLIVVTDQGKVYSIGTANGTKEWEHELDEKNADRLLTNPVVVGDSVVIVPLSAENLLYGLNSANGEQRWFFKP